MFLNRVVVGNGHILTAAQNNLTAPPSGFDSVSDFVIPGPQQFLIRASGHQVIANAGQALKNDELIVYNNDAIRTSWLLIYDK